MLMGRFGNVLISRATKYSSGLFRKGELLSSERYCGAALAYGGGFEKFFFCRIASTNVLSPGCDCNCLRAASGLERIVSGHRRRVHFRVCQTSSLQRSKCSATSQGNYARV